MTERTIKKFMVKSKFLDEMKDRIEAAMNLIESSIYNKLPILVRHHSDCDGYAAGITLERALLKRLRAFHRRETDIYYYYKRLPSKAPYYEYTDALKDITLFLGNVERFGRNPPLVIVADNGSSEQDIMSLKRLKQYGAKIIVIDHHPYSEEVDSIVDVHINPMMLDGYTYEFSAGMLCSEVAHQIDDETEVDKKRRMLVSALSGVSDKIYGEELNQYLKLAKEEGYTEERLREIGNCLDFELNHIGFIESRKIVDDLFFGDTKIMDKTVDMLSKEVEKIRFSIRKIVEKKLELVEKKDFILGKLDVDNYEISRGYPSRGKYAGVALTFIKENYEKKDAVLIAYGKDYMTFRGTRGFRFDLHELSEIIKKRIPYGTFGGGGHKLAGTINFQKGLFDEVFALVDEYIDNL